MTFIFFIFGLVIAGFQTLILKEIWHLNLRPKWIIFLVTPTLLVGADFFLMIKLQLFYSLVLYVQYS